MCMCICICISSISYTTPSLLLYSQVYLIINIKYNFTYVELFMLSEMYG